MQLTSITIRGMHKVVNKKYDLKRMNYFVGSNGSGKSTVLQAIQLALLGYIPGTDKTKSDIFKHCNGNMMMVELDINADGSTYTINRTWSKTTKGIVASVTTVPEDLDIMSLLGGVELPVFNFSEFMGMSSNKIKDWFINFLPSVDDEINWDQELGETISELGIVLDPDFVSECKAYVNTITSTGVQKIRDYNTYLKSQLSFKKGELTRVQNTIQSLIYYDDCDGFDDSEPLKEQNKQDQITVDDLRKKIILAEQNSSVLNELNSISKYLAADSLLEDTQYIEAKNFISNIEEDIQRVSSELQDLQKTYNNLMLKYDELVPVVNGKGVCPYSKSECSTVMAMYETCVATQSDLDRQITAVREDITCANNQKTSLYAGLDSYRSVISNLEDKYGKRDSLISRLDQDLEDIDVNSLHDQIQFISNSIESRTQKIIQIEANKRYVELTDKLTAEKFAIEQCIEILKAWIKLTDVNGLQSQIMYAPFKRLFMSMQQNLYQIFRSWDFSHPTFRLSEKSNSFSFGVKKDCNKYVEYDLLSSGEKCLYMLVLLIAIVRTSGAKLPIILVDDLIDHLDVNRIESCFETLYNITDVQFVLAGVSVPKDITNCADCIYQMHD